MKPHFVPNMLLRLSLGVMFLTGNAFAHPGHPGHDMVPSSANVPEEGKLLLAVIVTSLALFVTRSVYRKLP